MRSGGAFWAMMTSFALPFRRLLRVVFCRELLGPWDCDGAGGAPEGFERTYVAKSDLAGLEDQSQLVADAVRQLAPSSKGARDGSDDAYL